jgi:hypothetical protein
MCTLILEGSGIQTVDDALELVDDALGVVWLFFCFSVS